MYTKGLNLKKMQLLGKSNAWLHPYAFYLVDWLNVGRINGNFGVFNNDIVVQRLLNIRLFPYQKKFHFLSCCSLTFC
ncbi:hypothetical protein CDL12_16255 [Handroanthus impetiginosus]|uniref:Uncharacterized protein n=1 Tax=Handroanthus impetiginosus TaxID=429701 RepID=A0A2G9H0U8_9LAMI|nr:hypothetical protein CDL12_16255 [Handroanthus impetiginosus]